jgi:glycosyltransferase involved in cell wall biosynthesis
MTLVSIVTPSFNQAEFLERTMCSVIDQTYPHIEYYVMDGGSSDGSVELIQKYEKRLAGWVSEKDRGQTDAINKGFARSSGGILAWLNSDDTYEPEAVEKAVAFLQFHPEIGMVYADTNFINTSDKVIGKFPAALTDYARLRRGYVHIPQQAAFFRASLWKQVGPLDPTFFFAMDYDLWVRLAKLTPFAYVQEHWANFRLHGNAKTISADDRCWPEMLKVHFRDGGSKLAPIVFKYYLRLLAGPYLRWKRQLSIRNISES